MTNRRAFALKHPQPHSERCQCAACQPTWEELKPFLEQLKEAHRFKAQCLAEGRSARETGATRDAYDWCRDAAQKLADFLENPLLKEK